MRGENFLRKVFSPLFRVTVFLNFDLSIRPVMQFFGTPQRIAKKTSIGDTPMYPICSLAELRKARA